MRWAGRSGLALFALASCDPGSPEPDQTVEPGPLWFVDGTAESGLGAFHQQNGTPDKFTIDESFGAGLALLDADGDGDLDVYFTNGSGENGEPAPDAYFKNDGSGRFTDSTASAGLGDELWSYGVVAADFDLDGDQDLYVTNNGPNRLYRNDGSGRFEDVAGALGVDGDRWSTGAIFFDHDRDGDLDLYVVNHIDYDREAYADRRADYYDLQVYYGPAGLEAATDQLFRREDDGSYTDISDESGIGASAAFGFHVLTFDHDRDGWPDLYVANDSQANSLWRNRGDGTFEDIGVSVGVAFSKAGNPQAGMGAALGDTDNDGLEDLFVTNFSEDYYTLYRASSSGRYRDVTAMAGLYQGTLESLGWGALLEDLDGDGDLDVFAANGHVFPQVDSLGRAVGYLQANQVFENDGEGRFQVPHGNGGPGLSLLAASRGAALGDLNGDGTPDILVGNLDGPPTLLLNRSRGSWVRVRLQEPGRAGGVGVVLEGRIGDRPVRRTLGAGGGFLSSGDPAAWIGVGQGLLEELVIHWPGGEVTEVGDVPADHTVTVGVDGSVAVQPPGPGSGK